MGLLSWIKGKYYDHRLKKADGLAKSKNLSKAQLIYESLLGKQQVADAHLARMLVENASGVTNSLEVLSRVIELYNASGEASKNDINATLSSYVSTIESLSSSCFASGNYADAVTLLTAIKDFRRSQAYDDKLYRYNAYLSFEKANELPLSEPELYSDVVTFLNKISATPVSDIKELTKILVSQNRYARSIKFLLRLLNVGNWVKSTIFTNIVEIISNNDSERKNVKAYSDFCDDKTICHESAIDLARRANKKAQAKEYKTAVLYDKFASEFLSEDNSFNFDYCSHKLEELSGRAEATEIDALLYSAKHLKLSEVQLTKLTNRINEIAVSATPAKGLAICQLFIGQSSFNIVYLEKALSLAKSGSSIDIKELKTVIKAQTNESTLPNVLAPFVAYIPALEGEFVLSAINAILVQSSVDLLDKYWTVKNDLRFITSTVSKKNPKWKYFATHIMQKGDKYLTRREAIQSFCSTVRSNDDLEFTLTSLEGLICKKNEVKDFYVDTIISYATRTNDCEASIDLLNRGINTTPDVKLIQRKKAYIDELIAASRLERAEQELMSIIAIDDEVPTLLAELYFKRGNEAFGEDKVIWLDKVLDVNEGNTMLPRFNDTLQAALDILSAIAKENEKAGKANAAFEIAKRISAYWNSWIPLYVYLRQEAKDGQLSLSSSIKYDSDTIAEISSICPSSKDYPSQEFIGLWINYYNNTVSKSHSQPKDKAINSLSDLKESMLSFAPVSELSSTVEELTRLIVKLKWELAIEYEHEQSFDESIVLYEQITNDTVTSYINRAELRALICYVKAEQISLDEENRIIEALNQHSYQSLREDLAYRYACFLLKSTRPSDAENIVRTYLPDETTLLDMCENVYIKEAELKLDKFNRLVEKLNKGQMSVAEATEFKTALRDYKKQISDKLTDLGRPLSQFAPKIEAYILSKMFEEEKYLDVLNKLMQENPNYIEDNTDFHNVAIASLGLLESDYSDEPTLKRAIATSLTAIYSDRLFIQSLDYTSWDDKFTFTLDGSLGQTGYDDYEDLPENINFDAPVDNVNIAIADVQNSLLTRIETSVRKSHPELESFCNKERDALSKLIDLRLDKSYIMASPQLCRTLASIRMSIENAFEYELEQNYDNREDVIALGTEYGFSGPEYEDYNKGNNALLLCKSALSTTPSARVSRAFTSNSVAAIKKFKRLYADLKSTVGTAMNDDIRSEMDYKLFLDKYETICKTVADTTISLTCSNYVNGEVVHLLNDDSMQLRDGVGYMVRIYNIAPSNIQVKNNLEGILSSLVHKAEKENSTADRTALQNALKDLKGKFDNVIALPTIIAKVNNDRIEEYIALSQLYDLYQKDRNNSEVCEALAALAKLCIHKYIIQSTYKGRSDVMAVLDKLQNNKSAAFKEAAKILALEYLKILKSLPEDTRFLVMQGFSFDGSTLNSKGLALKSGLEYMKQLGEVKL